MSVQWDVWTLIWAKLVLHQLWSFLWYWAGIINPMPGSLKCVEILTCYFPSICTKNTGMRMNFQTVRPCLNQVEPATDLKPGHMQKANRDYHALDLMAWARKGYLCTLRKLHTCTVAAWLILGKFQEEKYLWPFQCGFIFVFLYAF